MRRTTVGDGCGPRRHDRSAEGAARSDAVFERTLGELRRYLSRHYTGGCSDGDLSACGLAREVFGVSGAYDACAEAASAPCADAAPMPCADAAAPEDAAPMPCAAAPHTEGAAAPVRPFAPAPHGGDAPGDLAALLGNLDASFSQTLLQMIDARGLADSQVYRRAHISRQLFSKIRKDPAYRPTKQTAVALALALELSLGEACDLLSRAGYALSHSSKFDVIVEYFIVRRCYDVFTVNRALYEFDQPLLGSA